jgi:hypothetical protein
MEGAMLPAANHKEVVVNLAAVLQLVDERNPSILLAREEVHEAVIAYNAARCMCLPECCRDDDFKTIRAESRVWKERAELAGVRYDTLVDAGTIYIDWLTARRTEAIFVSLENRHRQLLQKAEALSRRERGADILVSALKTVIAGHEQVRLAQRQQSAASAIKLITLMNLPDACLVPADADLPVMDLIDAGQPCEALLMQALTMGPGVRELEQLRAVIQAGLVQARCLRTLANLGCTSACARLGMLASKEQQVELRLEKTRSQLAGGVVQARDAILLGRQRIAEAIGQIQTATQTYDLSDRRVEQPGREETNSIYTTVMQSIRSLELAELAYVSAINIYDRAQLRLYLLLGNTSGGQGFCDFAGTTLANAHGGNTSCGFTSTTPSRALGGTTCCSFTPRP